jgi:hypothetical protein
MTSRPSAGGPPVFQSFSDMHQVLYGQVINSSGPSPSSENPEQENPIPPPSSPLQQHRSLAATGVHLNPNGLATRRPNVLPPPRHAVATD